MIPPLIMITPLYPNARNEFYKGVFTSPGLRELTETFDPSVLPSEDKLATRLGEVGLTLRRDQLTRKQIEDVDGWLISIKEHPPDKQELIKSYEETTHYIIGRGVAPFVIQAEIDASFVGLSENSYLDRLCLINNYGWSAPFRGGASLPALEEMELVKRVEHEGKVFMPTEKLIASAYKPGNKKEVYVAPYDMLDSRVKFNTRMPFEQVKVLYEDMKQFLADAISKSMGRTISPTFLITKDFPRKVFFVRGEISPNSYTNGHTCNISFSKSAIGTRVIIEGDIAFFIAAERYTKHLIEHGIPTKLQ